MSVSSEPICKGMLFVPINPVGVYHLDYGIEDDENILRWDLTPEENTSLWPVYNKFNDRFHLLVDLCEEETIPSADVRTALDILVPFEEDPASTEFLRSGLRKLRSALEAAVRYDASVDLCL